MSSVIALIITLLFTLVIITLVVHIDKITKSRVYVYKGNQYYLKGRCLIKDPTSRMWVNGIIYASLKTGNEFVREENDFLVKFVTYKQWKNGRNVKGS